jgi:Protein of unknown function (DUF3788)
VSLRDQNDLRRITLTFRSTGGSYHAAEDGWSGGHFFVRGLSHRGAPGLEQKFIFFPNDGAGFHGGVWPRRGLGSENAVGHRALKGDMPNAFAGRSEPPSQAEVTLALGKSQSLWQELVSDLKHDLGLAEQWGSSSIKAGWSLRLQSKKRNIVYLAPGRGSFLASFALGDRAIAAARQSKLPARVLKIIAEAKRYAEGTAVRIEVQKPGDVAAVKILAKIKLEN